MDDQANSSHDRNDFASLLQEHRERAAHLLQSQRSRVQRSNVKLTKRFQSLTEELQRWLQDHASSAAPAASQVEELRELDRLNEQINALSQDSAELLEARQLIDVERQELEQQRDQLHALRRELEQQQQRLERDEQDLQQRERAWADRQVANPEPPRSSSPDDLELMLSQLEEAQDQVQTLKQENAKLKQSLAQPIKEPSVAPEMNWEAEKKRILSLLEAEESESSLDPTEQAEIEKIVRRTDQIIAAKDEEILELQRLLQHQSENIGGMAVGAAAIGAMLDSDALIQQERQHLVELQEAWTEKMREAEIEISVERAKLAREKAELEAKFRQMEKRSLRSAREGEPEAEPNTPPQRGRWLQKLGIKDSDKR